MSVHVHDLHISDTPKLSKCRPWDLASLTRSLHESRRFQSIKATCEARILLQFRDADENEGRSLRCGAEGGGPQINKRIISDRYNRLEISRFLSRLPEMISRPKKRHAMLAGPQDDVLEASPENNPVLMVLRSTRFPETRPNRKLTSLPYRT